MNVIITGFGPFGDIEENPSSVLAEGLGKQLNCEVHSNIPVSVECVEKLHDRIFCANQFIGVHLGVNAKSTSIAIELVAVNEVLDDFENVQVIESDGPRNLRTPFESILRQWVSAHPHVTISEDAGRYLCNFIYYKSLRAGVRCVFVHVPKLEVLEEDYQLKTLADMVQYLVTNEPGSTTE
jgi:pyrrolidone-carboxylate peptidase